MQVLGRRPPKYEFLGTEGLIVANERSRKDNLLTANIQRHRSNAAIVVNHDGRHMPRLSGDFGYDAVLVDAPHWVRYHEENPEVWAMAPMVDWVSKDCSSVC